MNNPTPLPRYRYEIRMLNRSVRNFVSDEVYMRKERGLDRYRNLYFLEGRMICAIWEDEVKSCLRGPG